MKRQNILKSIFLLLIVGAFSSSCGLIEKFRKPEQPVDSKSVEPASVEPQTASESDDLFSKTMNDNKEAPVTAGSDAPSNITTDSPAIEETKQVKVEDSIPEIKAEAPQVIADTSNADAGKVMTYKVQKGETLMQIAFKIYGDISKWKSIQQMNGAKFSKNSSLHPNMELKYTAPAQSFVWNPEGTPYMIKTGETLGTISNSVYQTPKKWKSIWENNKPMIKNPNVIYAGFTLYYKGNGMANYVQPKILQRKIAAKVEIKAEENFSEPKAFEEIKIDQALSAIETLDSTSESDIARSIQSSTTRSASEDVSREIAADEIEDEALAH